MSDLVDLFDNSDHVDFDVPVFGVPKPSRALHLEKQEVARQARLKANLKRSAEKRRTSYGSHKGDADWQETKKRIYVRDRGRCLVCGQRVPIGTPPHHLVKVGAGGKNDDPNLVLLCGVCHARADEYRITRATLQSYLTERHGYRYDAEAGDA